MFVALGTKQKEEHIFLSKTSNLLQEIYSKVNDEPVWKAEWGGNALFSHGSCHSKGVCIRIDASGVKQKIEFSFRDNSSGIALTTVNFNRRISIVF